MRGLRFAIFVFGLILFIVSIGNFIVLFLARGSEITRAYWSAPTATPSPQTGQSVGTTATSTTVASVAPTAAATQVATEVPTGAPTTVASAAPTAAVTQAATEVPTSMPSPVPPTPTPSVESRQRLWFRGTPVAPLGTHVVQPREYLFCIGRAYGVPPQAIAEANFLDLDTPLFDGQSLQIPDVPWMNIPPGPICTPQFKSPYSPASVSMMTGPSSLLLNSHTVPGGPRWGEDGSISGELKLINFMLPKEQVKKVGSQLVSFAVTATPMPAGETRIVKVKWPDNMILGASDVVSLTLDLDRTSQGAASGTPSPGQTTATATDTSTPAVTRYSRPLVIPDVFDNYDVFAIARLDAVGFIYSPIEEAKQPVNKGEPVTWHWSIKPQGAEQQGLVISLRLQFEPKFDNVKPLRDRQIWSDSFTVNVRKPLFDWVDGIVATMTSIISMIITARPIWNSIISETSSSAIEESGQMEEEKIKGVTRSG